MADWREIHSILWQMSIHYLHQLKTAQHPYHGHLSRHLKTQLNLMNLIPCRKMHKSSGLQAICTQIHTLQQQKPSFHGH